MRPNISWWIESGAPVVAWARAAARRTFSSPGVTTVDVPISPMIPTRTRSGPMPVADLALDLGVEVLDRPLGDLRRVACTHVPAGAHDHVEAGPPRDLDQRRRVAPDPVRGLIDHRPAAAAPEPRQLLGRLGDVEPVRVVEVLVAELARPSEVLDAQRGLADGRLIGVRQWLVVPVAVEQDVLVDGGDAELGRGNRAEDAHHRSGRGSSTIPHPGTSASAIASASSMIARPRRSSASVMHSGG